MYYCSLVFIIYNFLINIIKYILVILFKNKTPGHFCLSCCLVLLLIILCTTTTSLYYNLIVLVICITQLINTLICYYSLVFIIYNFLINLIKYILVILFKNKIPGHFCLSCCLVLLLIIKY